MDLRNARTAATLVLLATALGVVGCARTPLRGQVAGGTDAKLSQTTYRQEGSQLALFVDTRLARLRDGDSYMPLEIAVANRGLPGLTLTLESFTLVDEEGNRYPAVSGTELGKNYRTVDVDRRLRELPQQVAALYASYTRIAAALTTSFDNPTPQTLRLPRFHYATELIYFPAPSTGMRGKRFDLLMTAPEVDDSIVVTFDVSGKPADPT